MLKLEKIANVDNNFIESYFIECEETIVQNLQIALQNDTKVEKVCESLPLVFGQLVVWDKEKVLKNEQIIYDTLRNINNEYMLNLICLQDGKSYIISSEPNTKQKLEILFNNRFKNNVMELENVWLRKEIIKKAIEIEGEDND